MRRPMVGRMVAAVLVAALSLIAKAEWFEDLEIGGDLRYRFERTDKEGSALSNRHSIRLRVGAEAMVNSNVNVEVRLATGSTAPNSAEQTLGGGFSGKDINLDRACFDWRLQAVQGLHVLGGKMANPFLIGNALVWDADVAPEGLAVTYAAGTERLRLLAGGGGFWVEERASEDDTILYGGQVAADLKTDPVGVLVGAGLYAFDNLEGYPVLVDEKKGYGNSTVPVADDAGKTVRLLYANEYNEVEGFVEVRTAVGPVPCKAVGHYVVNTEADADDTGYLLGIQIGQAKQPGSFQFDYDWRELEADAVVGALTDSNVWGGGTDGRGHRAYLTYQIGKRWQAGLEGILSEFGLDDPLDYNRLRAELKAKF